MDRVSSSSINQKPNSSSGLLQLGLGVVSGVVFTALVVQSVNIHNVTQKLVRIEWIPIFIGLLAYGLDFLLRSVRFWYLLDGSKSEVPVSRTVFPFIASFGISDVLPLRLGDIFRIWWFNKTLKFSVSSVIAAMVLERTLDLVSLAFLTVVALLILDVHLIGPIFLVIQIGAVATFFLGIIVLAAPNTLRLVASIIYKQDRPFWTKLGSFLESLAEYLGRSRSLPRMSLHLLLSSFIWLLESLVVICAWLALDGSISEIAAPFFAFTISTLGTLVPALPGHFGTYEYFGMLAFNAVNTDADLAVSVIFVAHMMLWLPTAVVGIGWLLVDGRLRSFRLNTAT